jgi:hypothetical protein
MNKWSNYIVSVIFIFISEIFNLKIQYVVYFSFCLTMFNIGKIQDKLGME